MKALRLIYALALAASASAAEIQFDPGAEVGMPALSIPVGARSTGMGGAYAAAGDDIYSLFANPAGLTGIQGYQLGMGHNEWASALGLRRELVCYGQNIGGDSALALAVDYFNLGSLDQRDGSGALLGQSNSTMLAGTLGYAWPLLGRLKAGLSGEFASQSLYGNSLYGFGAGAGLLMGFGYGLNGGLALKHFGFGPGGSQLPGGLQAGASAELVGKRLLLALDADIPFQTSPLLEAGAEYGFGELRLRAGWRQAMGGPDAAIQSGFSAGAGFQAGMLRLDYSYTPYGDLSASQRIQATVDLPRDFFVSKVSAPEGTSASAEAYFNTGAAYEKQGETLKALIQYQRCLESYPASLRAQPQAFYVSAAKKVEALQSELGKGGDHSQILKLSKDSLAAADKDLQAGHFKEALARLKQAKSIDPNNAALDAKIKEVQKALESKLSSFRDAAHFADSEKNLAMGVENYRKLLAVAPDDAEALAYLEKNRHAIKVLLQAADRKGVYFYVAGKLEEAIQAWSEGEALDYFGDMDFKRNIDKARKQLELSGN
jgi:hypothetical protein